MPKDTVAAMTGTLPSIQSDWTLDRVWRPSPAWYAFAGMPLLLSLLATSVHASRLRQYIMPHPFSFCKKFANISSLILQNVVWLLYLIGRIENIWIKRTTNYCVFYHGLQKYYTTLHIIYPKNTYIQINKHLKNTTLNCETPTEMCSAYLKQLARKKTWPNLIEIPFEESKLTCSEKSRPDLI